MAETIDVTMQENVLPTTEGSTLNADIGAALDKVAPDAPAEAPAQAEAPAPAETPATEGRQRDQFGRFLPKEGSPPGAVQAPSPSEAAPAPIAPPGAAAPTYAEPPKSWKQEMRPFYDKIPPEVRPYLHQREQELQHGFEAVARRGNVAEAVLNEFVPYAEQLQAEGATPITAIRTLLSTAHQLRTAGPEYRKAVVLSLAQQYNVDLSQPLNVELARAEAQAATLQTEKLYGSAANQQQTVQQTQAEFSAFAADPANEFFPQVRGIMALLIENNVARDLRTAYDMAIGMDANVRTTLIDREYQNRVQAQKSAAAANMSVKGAPGGAVVRASPPGGESLRATIERAFGD